jgi:23S rRNA pseudouridine2605 synthase
MLHKPTGIVTTAADQFGRKTVIDLIYENPKQYRELLSNVRLFPVGRLDYNTSGLLLITNDGDLTKRLTHPSSETQKVYIAAADRPITESELKILSNGVMIDGVKTAPALFEYCGEFEGNRKNGGFGAGTRPQDKTQIKIMLHEGRNRQIRKMFESIGVNVKALRRIAEGKLSIGSLKTGDWRFVRKNEIV